jgi:hypothetical protein
MIKSVNWKCNQVPIGVINPGRKLADARKILAYDFIVEPALG